MHSGCILVKLLEGPASSTDQPVGVGHHNWQSFPSPPFVAMNDQWYRSFGVHATSREGSMNSVVWLHHLKTTPEFKQKTRWLLAVEEVQLANVRKVLIQTTGFNHGQVPALVSNIDIGYRNIQRQAKLFKPEFPESLYYYKGRKRLHLTQFMMSMGP